VFIEVKFRFLDSLLVAVTSGHMYVFNKFQVFNTLGAQEQSGVRLLKDLLI
jgi:hypothetical protein